MCVCVCALGSGLSGEKGLLFYITFPTLLFSGGMGGGSGGKKEE